MRDRNEGQYGGMSLAKRGFATVLLVTVSAAFALEQRPKTSRFDPLVISPFDESLGVATVPAGLLPASDPKRAALEAFRAKHGPSWSMVLDRRSGAPLLASGKGIPWKLERGATIDSIAESLLPFIEDNRPLLLA